MTAGNARNILITGGCGRIGTLLARKLAGSYAVTLLDCRRPPPDLNLPFVCANIAEAHFLNSGFDGFDTVFHLAADPRPRAQWESLFPNNVAGTHNVVQATCAAKCRRLIFASSLHAVLGYPSTTYVHSRLPARPVTAYGVSKALGESIAKAYADCCDTSIICVRIGAVLAPDSEHLTPRNPRLELVITERDVMALLTACIEATLTDGCKVVHGVSLQGRHRFDMQEASDLLGFQPHDNAYVMAWVNFRAMQRKLYRGYRVLRRSKHRSAA